MDRSFLFSLFLLFSVVAYTISADEINGGGVGGGDDLLIKKVVSSDSDDDLLLHAEQHFSSFKARSGKSYGSEEEHDYRFGVFKANLRRAKVYQKLDPSAEHDVTKFSNLTPAEFQRNFLKLKRLRLPFDAQKAPILPTNDLSTNFDWREYGVVTGVKDQVQDFAKLIN
ncbi:hypothetical protein SO802_026699 [Lithocarpus litseifolius]|uniref:Cathepsin propeptide inhibitor domain-containing protein n=1 Tax=Lithocarpus litseifolius TaxID=425828 RepID=A0AAW2C409_9ROSI